MERVHQIKCLPKCSSLIAFMPRSNYLLKFFNLTTTEHYSVRSSPPWPQLLLCKSLDYDVIVFIDSVWISFRPTLSFLFEVRALILVLLWSCWGRGGVYDSFPFLLFNASMIKGREPLPFFLSQQLLTWWCNKARLPALFSFSASGL